LTAIAVWFLFKYIYKKNKPCKHATMGAYYKKERCLECLHEYAEQEARIQAEANKKRIADERNKRNDKTIVEIKSKIIQFKNNSIDRLRQMDPFEFENLVAELYRKKGYDVYQTPKTGDGGLDATLSKDKIKSALECKKYASSTSVGRPDIQKFESALRFNKAKYGIFVNLGRFTKDAIEFSEKVGIELIGPDKLLSDLKNHAVVSTDPEIFFSLECVDCGTKIPFIFDVEKNILLQDVKKCICGSSVKAIFDDPKYSRPVNINHYRRRRRRY
jgi:restriction endonuclease Mrr